MLKERCDAVIQCLDGVGVIQAELGAILRRDDDRRRHDLVAQRKALAFEIAKVAEIAGTLFDEIGDPVLLADYRRLFSAMRSKSAYHQSTWSAVRIGELDPEYLRSARDVADAHIQLIEWLRGAMANVLRR